MEEDNKEDEINIDFSKIKHFFRKKGEKGKVIKVENEAERAEKEVSEEAVINNDNKTLKEDEENVKEIREGLKKEEDEAAIIDAEKRLVEKRLEREKKEIKKIEKDVEEAKEKDEEISFDFSKIKNFFRAGKERGKKEADELSFDTDKIVSFFKKYGMVVLILIPMILAIYLRIAAYGLPITDEWAESTVYNSIQNQVNSQIRAENPNLPEANVNRLAQQKIQQVFKENKAYIESQVKELSKYFKKDFQRENGITYPGDIDPYFWMRHARNVIANGHPGDELRNQKTGEICYEKKGDCVPWDNHMIAPLGRAIPPDMFHAYFIAYITKFMRLFNPNYDLLDTLLLVPLILAALSVIPAFFIGRRISGNFGGFIAGLFVVLHPAFLTRTINSADTDAWNVLMPLLVTWLFLEAFETKSWKKAGILSSLAGLLVAVYTITWGGWWYIFDFLIMALVGYILIYILIHRRDLKGIFMQDNIKYPLLVLVFFFASSFIFSLLISNFQVFSGAWNGPFAFASLKEVGVDSVWPNVFTTVAELNPSSLDGAINQIGDQRINMLFFFLAIMGIMLTLTKREEKTTGKKIIEKGELIYILLAAVWTIIVLAVKPQNLLVFLSLIALPIAIKTLIEIYKKRSGVDFKLALILIIWFTSTIYASTKGIRFTLLLVPAFSISFGIALGYIYNYATEFLSKNLYLNKKIAKTIIAVLLLLLLVPSTMLAFGISKQGTPLINDAWYDSLSKVNNESSKNAIINSWWDYGHWFKAIGDRPTTFDGTSQSTPMAHWIGHSLLTNNENDAVGVLRMLDCGSNTAFEKLDESIDDIAKSALIIHDIVKMTKEDAKKYLLKYVDGKKADEVLKYTHCEPPENYYITSDDMIGKSGVWAHFGIWDFNRATIYNTLKKKEYENNRDKGVEFIMQRFNYTRQDAERLYYEVRNIKSSDAANSWIAPWPSYASSVGQCNIRGEEIVCPVNMQGVQGNIPVRINLANKTANIETSKGMFHPNAVVYPVKEGIKKIEFTNNTVGFSMTLIPAGENDWRYVMMVPPLEDSIYTQLYFLDGHGLAKFKKFDERRAINGNRVVIWKVDWNGTEKNVLPYFIEKEKKEEERIKAENNSTKIQDNSSVSSSN